MVAVIKTTNSLRNSLNYNEQKLQRKVAELIHSANFGKDTEQLGFSDKIRTLEKLAERNERTKLNSVHISLNFDPSEKLDKETLQKIADTYLQRIGFGDQPYLVYQHQDAGHPHLHVVTTNIRLDGSRISMQNIGRNQSEKARKEIEQEFGLVRAESHHLKQVYELRPVNISKVQYGKSDTRRAIINVLDVVLSGYKYASLPELNAILRQYNIVADRGTKGSRTYDQGGLLYRILDEKGQKIGIPIKASNMYNKPTLKFLQEKFKENVPLKQKHQLRVKNAIDLSFARYPGQSLNELITALQKERIQVVLRQNDQGIIYGLTYVDHQTKCVFNGSDLGKAYSANQIQQRCRPEADTILKQSQQQTVHPKPVPRQPAIVQPEKTTEPGGLILPKIPGLQNMVEELLQPENEGTLAYELREEQRKKKRKRLHQ
jgi:hypothetical protein